MHYIDIDGTLTTRQKRWAEPIPERIERVKAMIAAGMDVVIWSGTERYAKEWCKANGLVGKYAPKHILGKPNWMVDNQSRIRPAAEGGGRILGRRRIITPESWMEQTDGTKRVDRV
jgi:hypothetical protein